MVTIEEWTRYFGFKRFPFDRPEAGNEEFARPEFLTSCFVEPGNFDRILGQADAPVTALVFADRGVGKTATRVMVDYYCKRGFVPAGSEPHSRYVLSVPHIYLSDLVVKSRKFSADAVVLLEHHIVEILRRMVFTLTEMIAGETRIEQSVQSLTSFERLDVAWFMTNYGNFSTDQLMFLTKLGLILPKESKEVVELFESEVERSEGIPTQLVIALLQQRYQSSPLDHLRHLVALMPSLDISATYISVDGVDEFAESAGDPRMAYEVIRPLLGSLILMDSTPHLALKFYLPAGLRPLILDDAIVRKDRGFIMTEIRWQEADLIQMLQRRLDALRINNNKPQQTVLSGFDLLCTPELYGTIESELVSYVDGNPRQLFVLCGLMVVAHCTQETPGSSDPYLLNRYDLDSALAKFKLQITPYRIPTNVSVRLAELLEQDENEQLEYKSSMRWDYRRNSVNKALRETIAKAIVGMLNRNGGILVIGVSDTKEVLGVEKDLQTLNKKNLDGFHLELNHIVEDFFGLANRYYLQVRFEDYEDKKVCIITIQPSPTPVYLSSNTRREFYVRLGNTTRELDVSAALDYIHNHWKK